MCECILHYGKKLASCTHVDSLKLEVGKTYLDRKNNKIKIVAQEQNSTVAYYKWLGVNIAAGSVAWFRDGGGFSTPEHMHNNDLVKEYREPAVIYANEYVQGFTGSLFTTKEACVANTSSGAIRKAVKFVEVIEE